MYITDLEKEFIALESLSNNSSWDNSLENNNSEKEIIENKPIFEEILIPSLQESLDHTDSNVIDEIDLDL